jgi:hypothetical protein
VAAILAKVLKRANGRQIPRLLNNRNNRQFFADGLQIGA